jgi:aldehyde dehydrogenase (NAD+)
MGEEIFGPVLPIMTFEDIGGVIDILKSKNRPLALYLFTNDNAVKQRVVGSVAYGGGCINDTIIHVASTQIPFGGIGNSGMGSYHGKKSFETFTHYKGIIEKSNRIDIKARYLPGSKKKMKAIKKLMS